MFVCFNVFILSNIIYMLILLFAFASKLCLIVRYIIFIYPLLVSDVNVTAML